MIKTPLRAFNLYNDEPYTLKYGLYMETRVGET